jgi:DNA repair exonuclease SbcCD nuclease subunit
MSLRCLVIGDPHFKVTELRASEEMAKMIITLAREKSPDFIVCLGDTLDRHESIHVDPLCIATEWLWELSGIAKVYLLIGNHDRRNNSDFLSNRHPFSALHHWPSERVVVVDKVYLETIQDMRFFFVPYVPPGRFQEALETHPDWSPEESWQAGFSHQEFYGIQMAPNIFSQKGDHWPLEYPLLINGHIHDRNIPQPNIISVGTPRQHDFDESFNKALSLFTFFPEGLYQEEIIPVPLPKKIILKLSSAEFLEWEPPSPLEDYLKIEIRATGAELVALRKLDKIKKLQRMGIKIVTRDIEAGKAKISTTSQQGDGSFRERLALRSKEDPLVDKIYQRLFESVTKRKKRVIKIGKK